MKQFVTVFGEDPKQIAEPEPLKAPPAILQVVDKDGNVVYSVDTAADHAELTGNMKAVNAQLTAKAAMLPAVATSDGIETPQPELHPIPDEQQHYQALRYRWQLSVEIHNGQEPDNPWILQEEQDVPDPAPVDPNAPVPVTFEEVVQRVEALEQKALPGGLAQQAPTG